MKWDTTLRIVGILAIIGVYGLFTLNGEAVRPLIIALIAIVALISPEAIDKLPFGPVK